MLEKWQTQILRALFGRIRWTSGLRQYRTCYIEVPRKNGKSTIAARIALYLLFADGRARRRNLLGGCRQGPGRDRVRCSQRHG